MLLDKLGSMLLGGTITSRKAQEIIDNYDFSSDIGNNSEPDSEQFKMYVVKSGKGFSWVEDSSGEIVADANFYFDRDSFSERFLWLNEIECYERKKGHFYRLFDFVKKQAVEGNATNIRLEVDNHNPAVFKFESVGFYSIGEEDILSENINRTLMRYDLY